MGKAGVEDRCVQEMCVEGTCVKEFRVKVLLGNWEPSAPPRKVKVHVSKCTPAPQSEGLCHQVPRLPQGCICEGKLCMDKL